MSISEFLEENRRFWTSSTPPRSERVIVLDLYHNANVHSHLFANCVVAKCIQHIWGGEIVGIFTDDFGDDRKTDVEAKQAIARSFGVSRFYNISEFRNRLLSDPVWSANVESDLLGRLEDKSGPSLRNAVRLLSEPKFPRRGLLIYNEFLRRFGSSTIDDLSDELIAIAKLVSADYEAIAMVLGQSSVRASVLGHIGYSVSGQIADFSAMRGAPTFLVEQYIPIAVTRYRDLTDLSSGLPGDLKEMLESYAFDQALLGDPRLDLFDGAVEATLARTIDPLLNRDAVDQPPVSREDFLENCGVDPKNPTVCVFAHVFQDAPLTRPKQLSDDYWQAIVDVVDLARQLTHLNLIIKPHPLNAIYDRERSWDRLREYCAEIKNVGFADGDLSAGEVMKHCDAGLTVRGTVLYEMAAAGHRMIATGEDKFSGLGIIEEASSMEALKSILMSVSREAWSMPAEQRQRALAYSYCLLQGFRSKSILVPDKRWPPDEYFRSATLALSNFRLEEDPLFINLKWFLRNDLPMLISKEAFPEMSSKRFATKAQSLQGSDQQTSDRDPGCSR
ncbi:hypothetical protein Nwi_0641 [Nitrobacter winogradskyi Nb-255]|uniref:Capsule polysaccharide biosynthesis n=1 Tax=Nitrobacter winogradskyi (strain ATCC 25391 / DSM 10237 / CIP 104748 / NCIMB 11846 / Nb-255) TaxID=323098 RepID=Q3SUY3_NITWN|nr:hypothetical protein [Nitrobacter winogradskyi]ABA03908.1 hypothetical protein Nwi_0641 [Nitrobacter winogradskyi Nb-255]